MDDTRTYIIDVNLIAEWLFTQYGPPQLRLDWLCMSIETRRYYHIAASRMIDFSTVDGKDADAYPPS